jgi:hypothetical protein
MLPHVNLDGHVLSAEPDPEPESEPEAAMAR